MSNYKDYLIGAGSANFVPAYEQTWTKVAEANGFIVNSNYSQQSSTTYQAYCRLATKGVYGCMFDPYQSNNSGLLCTHSFKIDQSTGAITVNSYGSIWSHSYGQIFSTCHFGAVGHTIMNIGHHKSQTYGSTHKGWIYAAEFDTNGALENYGNSSAPYNMWPHSNGDLVMGTTASKDGYAYGRRSTYNQNDSKYWHQRGYHSNGSVGYNDYNSVNANTSTNYAYPNAMSSYNDLTPGGYVGWQDSSANGVFTPIYGSNADRASNLSSSTYFGDNGIPSYVRGYHLSNGKSIYLNTNNNQWLVLTSTGVPEAGTYNGNTAPASVGLLGLTTSTDTLMRATVPLGNDTWLIPNSTMGGFLKLNIDINNNYAVSISKHYHTLLSGMGYTPQASGCTYDVTGSSDQYFVFAKVTGGAYNISVFNNPFV